MLRTSTLTLLFLAATALPADAQSPSPSSVPFGTAALSLGVALDAGRSANLAGWEPSPGIEIRALFPFYTGTVEIGIAQSSLDSRVADVPGFRARYTFIGWGAALRPVRRLRWRTGVRLGVYDLQFDDESLPEYARSENEVATELVTELDGSLGRGWSVIGGAGGRLVFTEPRIRELTLSAGLRRTFVSPEWLRDFLD
ncbi:MAG TPA: hypothetical protein VFT04_03330 [Gemmatimonadales bacterium]|nr:hypothetical protein [Gemmatimonadales bacterium]